ncbi:MAG TPA: PAS domain-containing protein, partial [Candidatus Dormibacteraeota bacterium]|nr:PAS domain-containing protein [Candidatus Dormibacteraeota bacterium]
MPVTRRFYGREPVADWPAGALIGGLCVAAFVFVLIVDLYSESEITVGGLGVIAILAAASVLTRRMLIAVVTVAVMLRFVSVFLGGVNPASALTQIAAYVLVAGLTFLAADAMRAALQSARRVDRLSKVVSAAIDLTEASSSPMDWVQKLMVFSVKTVDADRSNVSRFEGDEMVVEASFDQSEEPLAVGSRWKTQSQPMVGELIRTKRPVQGKPALPADLAPEVADVVRQIRHYLLIPLVYEDEVHGTIALARYRDPAFESEAVESVQQVAHLASLALRSSKLYDELVHARFMAEASTAQLLKRERQLDEAQRMAHLGSYEYSVERGETSWSSEVYRFFGRDPSTGGPISFDEVLNSVHPMDRELVTNTVNEAIQTLQPYSFEYRIVRPDGEIRTMLSRGTVMTDGGRHAVTLVGTAQDITDMKRAQEELIALTKEREDQLRQHARRMEALEKVKTEFLLLASHELRGPLAVINGYVSLMQTGMLGELPEPARSVIPTMSAQGATMKSLIDEMLETARLEQTVELDLEPVDLRDAVREAVDTTTQPTGSAERVRLEMPGEPVDVLGDRLRLVMTVSALIDNALKYSAPRRAVTCTVDVEYSSAVVIVRDRGHGISAQDMPRLFTRFGRIVTPDNARIQGTGLGLYL